MSEANPFSAAKLIAMREEIRRDGLLADKFLVSDPDVPTFGLNLACAWPFPEAWRASYERMAQRLNALGPWVYVYPFPTTHVTLVTLVSFARHIRPPAALAETLQGRIPEIIAALAPLFAKDAPERIRPFTLQPQAPVLARGAGFLPFLDSDGNVSRLRQRTMKLLQANEPLHHELTEHGLNVPGIVHSTLLRFRQPPPDLDAFLVAFDKIAADTKFPAITGGELLLTSEIKPYMRGGKVLHRFKLSEN